ncbi:MAG: hypothetical protein ABH812_02885 [bacterium]
MKNNVLIPGAGIDESNSAGYYIQPLAKKSSKNSKHPSNLPKKEVLI